MYSSIPPKFQASLLIRFCKKCWKHEFSFARLDRYSFFQFLYRSSKMQTFNGSLGLLVVPFENLLFYSDACCAQNCFWLFDLTYPLSPKTCRLMNYFYYTFLIKVLTGQFCKHVTNITLVRRVVGKWMVNY